MAKSKLAYPLAPDNLCSDHDFIFTEWSLSSPCKFRYCTSNPFLVTINPQLFHFFILLAQMSFVAGYVTQCVLTPNTWFVIRHPLSNLLNKCAAPCNYFIISWLKEQQPGEKGVNVVITDFFDFDLAEFPFVKTVVLLNRKHKLNHNDACGLVAEEERRNPEIHSHL